MSRVERLREGMLNAEHGRHRVLLTADWLAGATDCGSMDCSLPERKAYALSLMLERMPIFIEEEELIVGSRTIFGTKHPEQVGIRNPSVDVRLEAYPPYLTEAERAGGASGEGRSKGHYVAGYRKALEIGFDARTYQAQPAEDHKQAAADFRTTGIIISHLVHL